ncbi:MAG: hypothetical protein JO001_07360 [Alphaproteobacteria bacterium]|nr:hypothetical protein [Alphaproteobacteria bacterium]
MTASVAQITADRAFAPLRRQVLRQLTHWEGAAERLDDFEANASAAAWARLERYVGVTLRGELKEVRDRLKLEAAAVRATFAAARNRAELERVADQVLTLRDRYLQCEALVDFYVDAVQSRANPEVGAQLRACDVMAERAIMTALEPLRLQPPPLMTYFKPGVGASVMRINTRLWDGSRSCVAAIKITWHNRLRPTALIHECGHQVAGLTGWNEAFARALLSRLAGSPAGVAEQMAIWASEIAADSFAFAHAGYAAVAALSDVVSGRGVQVFRYIPEDVHPIAYLRVLLAVEMCRRFYGMGPWDELEAAWRELHPLASAPAMVAGMIRAMIPALPRVVEAALLTPLPCFAGKRLVDLVDPQRVSPGALRLMQRDAGAAAFNSSHWIWTECLRLTALSGLRYAIEPEAGREILKQQEDWMIKLGNMTALQAA